MRKLLSLIIFGILFITNLNAQSISLGSWREYLPYLHGRLTSDGGNRVFCATDEGLFSYSKDENSVQRLSRLNGLNDFGINTITYNTSRKVLIIGYSNANIDLLFDDNRVLNLSDIKRKNVPGNKTINSILISGKYAFLACGFGIVILDLDKNEVKDTYFIGANGASINVYQVSIDNNFIYAATEDGIYRGGINDPNLSNYTNWTKILNDTGDKGDFTSIVNFNNIQIVNYSRRSSTDTIMAYDGNWGVSTGGIVNANRNNSFIVSNNELIITNDNSINIYNSTFNLIRTIDGSLVPNPTIKFAFKDDENIIWAADNKKGLLKISSNTYSSIIPDGPNSTQFSMMRSVGGKLWAAHGPRNGGWFNQYDYKGFSSYENSDWVTIDNLTDPQLFNTYNMYDIMGLAVDNTDKNHLFLSSGGGGLMEYKDGAVVKLYRETNSTLKVQFGNPGQVKVHGIAYDGEGNLWCANAGVNTVLNVLKNDGTWKNFNLAGLVNSSSKAGDLIIDNNGIKWVILFENIGGKEGILAYDDRYTIDDVSDDQSDIVEFGTNRVRTMTLDLDGVIWVGTEKGIYLIYPPSTTAQQILIKQDNTYQYLLETDIVTAIAVDAANQKWVGTENGGVFLFSADGQTEINHFTIDNSPIFSNNISSININGKTGEVYIGTDKGLISYQGTAIEGGPGCTDLLVYPNPVRKEYTGPIAIKGVVPNGIIKITDVVGNLVYQAKSSGAQAIWNGTNLNGERVQSGVYIVFSSDAAGTSSCLTKLTVIH